MLMRHTFAALALTALALPAHADWSASNSNGGSGGGSTTCSRVDGQRVCETTSTWTTAAGKTYSSTARRVYDQNGVSGTRIGIDPSGRERVTTWRRDR